MEVQSEREGVDIRDIFPTGLGTFPLTKQVFFPRAHAHDIHNVNDITHTHVHWNAIHGIIDSPLDQQVRDRQIQGPGDQTYQNARPVAHHRASRRDRHKTAEKAIQSVWQIIRGLSRGALGSDGGYDECRDASGGGRKGKIDGRTRNDLVVIVEGECDDGSAVEAIPSKPEDERLERKREREREREREHCIIL